MDILRAYADFKLSRLFDPRRPRNRDGTLVWPRRLEDRAKTAPGFLSSAAPNHRYARRILATQA